MNIPISNQIPNEAMFYEGRLTASWLMFFQRMAKQADLTNASNLLELVQLASLQPTQAIQGEQAKDIELLQLLVQNLAIPIAAEQTQALPLSPVAFFCATETLPIVSAVLPVEQAMPCQTPQQLPNSHSMPMLTISDEFLQVISR